MNDVDIVLCGPLWTATTPGSKLFKCTACGEDCAAGPIGQKKINEGAKPYCAKCGIEYIAEAEARGDTPQIVDPTEAIKEAFKAVKDMEKN